MDANSQDVSVLIGTEDISKLDLYPEDDPRVLIIDDYGDFPGCRKAVDEYFLDKNVLMIGVDKSCRVIIKD